MEPLKFETGADFRQWLAAHGEGPGVWLLFGKPGGPATLSAAEALEEALCAGWIDGQMEKIDQTTYKKYFAPRRPGSNWSEKNKKLSQALIEQGRMTERGLAVIERSKANGTWDKPKAPPLDTDEHLKQLELLLSGHEPACSHYLKKSLSVRKTYSRMYFDAKSQEARQRRLAKIIDRLNRNLNPM